MCFLFSIRVSIKFIACSFHHLHLGNSVVKGTSAYRGVSEGHQDIDTGTLLQMIGRAGRPGFDTSGTAVIMTDTLSKTRFENMSQG